jgi:predicted 3-demethylubiquinone-9 3-methyltransferase (glyoxalase superfamily)
MARVNPKIVPFLWFNDNAEEAMNFYVSIFPNSKIVSVSHYSEAGPEKPGSVMVCAFDLAGQRFNALNGGPHFKFTEAVSFFVECEDQKEVDYYWDRLLEGGTESQCGWLKDKFGLSWQIVPRVLMELNSGPDGAKAARVMNAMFKMKKLIVADLEAAAAAG